MTILAVRSRLSTRFSLPYDRGVNSSVSRGNQRPTHTNTHPPESRTRLAFPLAPTMLDLMITRRNPKMTMGSPIHSEYTPSSRTARRSRSLYAIRWSQYRLSARRIRSSIPPEIWSAGRAISILTGPLERRLRSTLMQYSNPVMKLRYSENRSAGASTNISSGLVSDTEMTWGDRSAMKLWSSRFATPRPIGCRTHCWQRRHRPGDCSGGQARFCKRLLASGSCVIQLQ